MRFLTAYHRATRTNEMARNASAIGKVNGWKGYVPSTQREDARSRKASTR